MLQRIVIIALLAGTSLHALAQGCSDAGFCTMGAMKPDQPFNKKVPIKLRSMEVSLYRGTTTLTPIVYVATVDMNFGILGNIDDKTSLQVKLPYLAVKGNFGSNSGLSDISLCLTRNIISKEEYNVGVSVGTKIPTNNSNQKNDENGLAYPMYYQTSLGTYDFIAGVSMITKKWLFATGVQYAFNKNNNTFTWADWIPVYNNGESPDYVKSYSPCYELKRGTDVMLRVERNFRYSRFNFSAGLLPIIRITKDEVTDVSTGERVKLDGTTGMALSGIITAGYAFNVQSGIKVLMGKRITHRDLNPDGLTRETVNTVSYYYRF